MESVWHDPTDERIHRKAIEVLSSLDRWNDRSQGHYTQRRKYDRQPFRLLSVLVTAEEPPEPGEPPKTVELRVWSRNLSQGGVGFIYPEKISANNDEITICLNPDAQNKVWLKAQIVRCRPVHEGFWEYGAMFVGRRQ